MKNYKHRAGVTLLELIVAMGILTIASTSVLAMLFSSVQANVNAHRITVATFNAQQGVEEFVGRQWLDGTEGLNRFPWGVVLQTDLANNIPMFMVATLDRTEIVDGEPERRIYDGGLDAEGYAEWRVPVATANAPPPLPYHLAEVRVAIFENYGDATSFAAGTGGRRLAHHAHIIDVGPGSVADSTP